MKLLLPASILLAIAIFTSCSKTVDKSSAKNIIAFYLKNADGSALDTSKVDVSMTMLSSVYSFQIKNGCCSESLKF